MTTDNNAPADDVVARLRIGTPDNPKHEVVWVQNLRAHLSEGMFSRRFFPEWCDIFLENFNALLQAATEAAAEIERLRAERDEALRIAKNVSKALTGLTPGGSEYHSHSRVLDDYFADAEVCVRVVRERFEDGHKAKLALADAQLRIRELEDGLRGLLRAEYESASHGLLDCIDNHGKHYQSQFLADQIKRAEELVSTERNSK